MKQNLNYSVLFNFENFHFNINQNVINQIIALDRNKLKRKIQSFRNGDLDLIFS
jgi:hypothetical protein